MNQAQAAEPTTTDAKKTIRSLRAFIGLLVLFIVACGTSGFVHIVYSSKPGQTMAIETVCAKDGWALEDTFVNVDDYAGHPLISLLPKAKVTRALFACHVLERPKGLGGQP